ncbi:MAG: homoserine O-acetyltransferase [Anaerolineae bacterium]|nr:homoserine O-acetyltransferase [Gloeobacterales cyanobacterium ES-bin-313]
MDFRPFFSPETRFWRSSNFVLESGEQLEEVEVAYRTWGNFDGDNAVLVCHALTGSADADTWWAPLLGSERSLDPARNFIICSNILASCYGTTGPASLNPRTGRLWGADFPSITIRDMVRLQALLLNSLGIQRLKLVLGGSLGGMQALEWALLYPERVEAMAAIACSGRHSAWCIGLSEAQRQTIFADPLWQQGHYDPDQPPAAGLAAARMVAMCTYRSQTSFEARFGRERNSQHRFAIAEYLRYQGTRLVQHFDANAYVALTYAMDAHDVGENRGSYETALASILIPTLIVAIDSDVLYPPEEQQELARFIPDARFAWLHSDHGHDAFLIEMDALDEIMLNFRANLGKDADE